jgi:diguanylate cyclase (GGDEF)-like protein
MEAVRQSLSTLNWELASTQREMKRAMQQLNVKNELIEHLSVTDDLTGLGNRRRFNGALASEIARAKRGGLPVALLMLDIDHFKAVNDTYGHSAGDTVLQEFARLIALELRVTDTSARYGGEEFVVLLPATRLAEAGQLAERLRLAFEGIRPLDSERVVTASFGVAEWHPDETGEQWLLRADTAMYLAKAQGRNRVVMDSSNQLGVPS